MASGIANLSVLAIQRSLTMPGRRNSSTATSASSRTISGISGRSRMSRRQRRLPAAAGRRHEVRLRSAISPPSMTTMTMIVPSMIVVMLGSMARR